MSLVSEDTAGDDLDNNDNLKALIAGDLFGVVGGHKHLTFARVFERPGRAPLHWVNPGHLAPPPGRAPGYCVWHLEDDRVEWRALDASYPEALTLRFGA